MIVNVITRPEMKLEHPEDLSFFYECRTFLYKKILSGYVRVLDLSSFLPPLLNNVGLKKYLRIQGFLKTKLLVGFDMFREFNPWISTLVD